MSEAPGEALTLGEFLGGSRRRRIVAASTLALLLLLSGLAGFFSKREVQGMIRQLADPLVLIRVEEHALEIEAAAAESELDPCLVAGVVYCESSGRVGVVSSAGALGLMQLIPDAAGDAARRLGLEVPSREVLLTDGALNLRLGASQLAWTLKHEEGNVERALCAYNAGRTRLRRWINGAGSYTRWREERLRAGDSKVLAYAQRVLDYRETFRERGVIVDRSSVVRDESESSSY